MVARLLDLLSGLLGQKAPEFMTAAGFSDSPHFMYSGEPPNFLFACRPSFIRRLMDNRLPSQRRVVPALLARLRW